MSPFLLIGLVLGAGTAINVQQSGDAVNSPKEAVERIASDIKIGYSQPSFTSFKLND